MDINLVAVLGAAVVNMALGFLWYSPVLFSKPWMDAMGKKPADFEKQKQGMGKVYAGSFIAALVMAYVLAHFARYSGATTAADGVIVGFWAWLGFVATVTVQDVFFGGKNWTLFAINNGYNLVALMLMGVVVALWG